MITDAWKNLLRDALRGAVTDVKIKYLAWGDDPTTPTADDIALGNELGRKPVTLQTSGATGILDTIQYLSKNDANASIYEIGFFGGSEASMSPGSGTLVCRFHYKLDKNNLKSVLITLRDVLTEG